MIPYNELLLNLLNKDVDYDTYSSVMELVLVAKAAEEYIKDSKPDPDKLARLKKVVSYLNPN